MTPTPTIEAQVRAAASPLDALLVLARAVDALRATPSLNSWDGWGTAAPAAPPSTRDTTILGPAAPPVAPREISDDALMAFLAKAYGAVPDLNDPEARGRLEELRQELAVATGESEPEHAPVFVDETGVVDLDMSPVDEDHWSERYCFARDDLKLELALGPHPDGKDWAEQYAQLGPMMLYITQREMLLQYPEPIRQQMILDLKRYDERVAAEVGRDLLRRDASDRNTALPLADSFDGTEKPE